MKRALSVELRGTIDALTETQFAEAEARGRASIIAQRQADGMATIDPDDECIVMDPSNPDGGLTRVFYDKALRMNVIVRTFPCCRCAKRWQGRRELCCWNVVCSRCGATVTAPSYISRDLPACCADTSRNFTRRVELP